MDDDIAVNIFNNVDDKDCDNNNNNNESREPSVYVFGYGSLIWNPGFQYTKCITGCKYATIIFLILGSNLPGVFYFSNIYFIYFHRYSRI